jgi:hypothetical protein
MSERPSQFGLPGMQSHGPSPRPFVPADCPVTESVFDGSIDQMAMIVEQVEFVSRWGEWVARGTAHKWRSDDAVRWFAYLPAAAGTWAVELDGPQATGENSLIGVEMVLHWRYDLFVQDVLERFSAPETPTG